MTQPDQPPPNGSLDHEALIERVVQALGGAEAKTGDTAGSAGSSDHYRNVAAAVLAAIGDRPDNIDVRRFDWAAGRERFEADWETVRGDLRSGHIPPFRMWSTVVTDSDRELERDYFDITGTSVHDLTETALATINDDAGHMLDAYDRLAQICAHPLADAALTGQDWDRAAGVIRSWTYGSLRDHSTIWAWNDIEWIDKIGTRLDRIEDDIADARNYRDEDLPTAAASAAPGPVVPTPGPSPEHLAKVAGPEPAFAPARHPGTHTNPGSRQNRHR